MKLSVAAFSALLLGCALCAPAFAQTYQNEISLFGAWDSADKPADTDTVNVNVRYGRFMTPRIVAEGTLGYNRFETKSSHASTSEFLVGAKYYFGEAQKQGELVPFADVGIGFANIDTPSKDSTDLAWEIGGGASMFLSERTSIDTALRLYHINTNSDTEGVRLSIGLTTRF
jgi:opacity protein-like surface antigen